MKNNNLQRFLTERQSEIAIITALGMVLGFLCARAVLSLSMFLFFLNAIWNTSPKSWLKQTWWLAGLAWVAMYALSYFWSDDIPYWQERFQVKFPYVILPIAFGLLRPLSFNYLRWLSYGMIIMVFAGCVYSLSFYFADSEKILSEYFYAKVFPTPAYKDHIRFSIFVAWLIIWCSFIYRKLSLQLDKILFICAIIFFTLYLHILAVRSGLLVLYTFAFLYVIYLFLRKKIILAGSITMVTIALGFTIYKTVPSFRLKLHYTLYSLSEYKKGNKSADFSDIGRIISYELAAELIKENPLLGVGAGDIREEMKKKYEIYSPDTKPEQRIVPHNQIMEVALAGGMITLSIFLYWLFFPILKVKKNRDGFYLLATWFVLLVTMMVEAMLEVQLGVFVYLFCILWIMKATQRNNHINPPDFATAE
ncbi:MAG: O-antigen ligase family protein [Chitinophagaceae bacterium]